MSIGGNVQVPPLTPRVEDLEQQALYSSVPLFYDFLQNRVLVQFKPRYEEQADKAPEFDLMLSKKMVYETVGLSGPQQESTN